MSLLDVAWIIGNGLIVGVILFLVATTASVLIEWFVLEKDDAAHR